jgi:hypothetical protein
MPANSSPARGGKRYFTITGLQARYDDCSKMWIERRMEHDNFPKPDHYFGGRRFWSVERVEAWEQSRSPEPPAWLANAGEKGKAAAQAGREAKAAKRVRPEAELAPVAGPPSRKPRPLQRAREAEPAE